MNGLRKQLPEGVQDYLPGECSEKNLIIDSFKKTFYKCGYDMVQTPVIEYLDVYTGSHFPVENMMKIIDRNGRIAVLRPDLTLPIARMVAASKLPLPARLCYVGEVFNMRDRKETTQVGIELIGDSSINADFEVVSLAISALSDAGLKNIQIELGQVEFFKGLMEEAGLDEDQTEELRQMTEQKNMLGVEIFLKNANVSGKIRQNLLRLSRLFGTEEVLDEAEKMSSNPRCRNAVRNLRLLWSLLADYGLKDRISVDLGILHSIDYYTGMVFRGLAEGIGAPVLTGGRYDSLLAEFGRPSAATGFGVDISRVMLAMESQGILNCTTYIDSVIMYEKDSCVKAFLLADSMRESGQRVVVAHYNTNAREYALANGAKTLYTVSGDKVLEEVL
ncbi:MAG TPA: ATP phosphoribosyltransferase regulatory subunit [Clostridia bacterium]|nr:ATP phosphoribosyltransferase regulatory subunit [Clostridia bacterium]